MDILNLDFYKFHNGYFKFGFMNVCKSEIFYDLGSNFSILNKVIYRDIKLNIITKINLFKFI